MRFKRYLVEMTIKSLDHALEVFGMKADELNADSLKSKYRKLAMQHHPDDRGDKEKSQEVNDAHGILQRAVKQGIKAKDSMDAWKIRQAKEKAMAEQIKQSLLSDFHPEIYTVYFNKHSGFNFDYKIKEGDKAWPGFDVEFFTKDRKTVFFLKISASITDVMRGGLTSGDDISYTVYTDAQGFHLNKKQKMSQRDWGFTRDHSFLKEPQKLFPVKKMKDIFSGKTSKRTFKKRDMESFFKAKLGAKLEYSGGQTQAAIPLGDNEDGMPYTLIIYRVTFDRVGIWMVNGIYLKKGKYGYGSKVDNSITSTFVEEEETAKIFDKIQKEVMKVKGEAKIKKTNDLLKLAFKAYKKSKGI